MSPHKVPSGVHSLLVKRPGLHILLAVLKRDQSTGRGTSRERQRENACKHTHTLTHSRMCTKTQAPVHTLRAVLPAAARVQGPADRASSLPPAPPFRWEAGRGKGGPASTGRPSWPTCRAPDPWSDPSLHLGCGQRRQWATVGWPSSPCAPGSARVPAPPRALGSLSVHSWRD